MINRIAKGTLAEQAPPDKTFDKGTAGQFGQAA
jgi:hypothetical protein